MVELCSVDVVVNLSCRNVWNMDLAQTIRFDWHSRRPTLVISTPLSTRHRSPRSSRGDAWAGRCAESWVCCKWIRESPIARGSALLSICSLFPRFRCKIPSTPSSPPERTHVNFYAPPECGSAPLNNSRPRGLLFRSLYRRHISMRPTLTNSPRKAFSSRPLTSIKSPRMRFNPA